MNNSAKVLSLSIYGKNNASTKNYYITVATKTNICALAPGLRMIFLNILCPRCLCPEFPHQSLFHLIQRPQPGCRLDTKSQFILQLVKHIGKGERRNLKLRRHSF